MPPETQIADLLVAALVGLAVGIEREWSGHATGPDARFAGLRTFTLLGAIGGFAGWMSQNSQSLLAICFVAGSILFVISAYVSTMRRPGTTADGTTEVAAILVVAMGTAAGLGFRTVASAAAAVVVVLLAEKSWLQRTLQRIGTAELRATVQFAVMALVVLPMLPDRAFGPYGAFQPRQLWTVVLLFSGLNFAGYIARKLVGETRGLGITGLLGGMISSTAVTFTFSRRSRAEPALAAPLAIGVVAACTALQPRLLVIATTLQPALLPELIPLLGPALLAGLVILVVALVRDRDTRPQQGATPSPDAPARATIDPSQNPLALATALQMAVAFQVVLFIMAWTQATIGNPGVLVSAAILGLTDMDALTLSMTRLAADAALVHVAALAIGIGVIANTVLKLAVAMALGVTPFRVRTGAALLTMAAAGAAALAWRW